MDEQWFSEMLVCPRDRSPLKIQGNFLVSAAGCQYPVIDDIPVMLVEDAEQTITIANDSIGASQGVEVRDYWEEQICGVRYGESSDRMEFLLEIERFRYHAEPFIPAFADFKNYGQKKVLEIGVGAGVDFSRWVKNGAHAVGIDLTEAALKHTRERIKLLNPDKVNFTLVLADAENLCFRDNQFDLVYAYGCFHHSPRPEVALEEAYRVLKPGGELKAMVYHIPSWTGWLLWFVHCFLKGKPWQSPRQAIFRHLESPATKAYTSAEARQILEGAGFVEIKIQPKLGPGDLLMIKLSEKYKGRGFRVLQKLYPRWFVRALGDRFGLDLLIRARKPDNADSKSAVHITRPRTPGNVPNSPNSTKST